MMRRVSSFPALMCVLMLVVVSIHPVLANPPVSEPVSGDALFPGVRGITLTEVGVDSIRTRESLVEVHDGVVDVKIRDPLATSRGKRGVPDLSGDDDLAAVGDILGRDGYVVTGVTEHRYRLAVAVEGASPSVREDVTYYTFTNVDMNTSRVVMAVQVVAADGAPVGDRRIMVTPVVGEKGIVGSDELLVYEPLGGTTDSGSRSRRGDDIECGEPDERTPLLTHTGVAVTTVLAGTVGAAMVACVGSGGIACPVAAVVVVGALVIFAGVNVVGYMVDTASYTTETRHVAEDSPIREFTLVKDSIGGGAYVAPGSHIHYRADGSVHVTTPAPWWKRWSSKGLICMYAPLLTTDDTYAVTATRDIEAPSGSEFVFPTSNTMTVKHKGKIILDAVVDGDGGCGHDQNPERSRRQDTAFYTGNRFLEFANQSHVSGIKHLEAQLVVPSSPSLPSYVRNAFVSLWIGVGPDDGSAIVQPVLGYDHQETGKRWAIAAWAVRNGGGDIACGPKGHSEWYYPNTGDTLNLALNYDSGRWEIAVTDVTSRRSTRCSSAVVGNSDVEVFGGVLEGAGLFKTLNGENIADKNLPGTATFSKIQSNVPLTLRGVVDPNARNCFTNLGVDVSADSKMVTLHTANR
jgi:hypothetical protein